MSISSLHATVLHSVTRIDIFLLAVPQFVATCTAHVYVPTTVGRPESLPSVDSVNPAGKFVHVHSARVTGAFPLNSCELVSTNVSS